MVCDIVIARHVRFVSLTYSANSTYYRPTGNQTSPVTMSFRAVKLSADVNEIEFRSKVYVMGPTKLKKDMHDLRVWYDLTPKKVQEKLYNSYVARGSPRQTV